jgi:hypothetical protein
VQVVEGRRPNARRDIAYFHLDKMIVEELLGDHSPAGEPFSCLSRCRSRPDASQPRFEARVQALSRPRRQRCRPTPFPVETAPKSMGNVSEYLSTEVTPADSGSSSRHGRICSLPPFWSCSHAPMTTSPRYFNAQHPRALKISDASENRGLTDVT